jgi:hypothetical protein
MTGRGIFIEVRNPTIRTGHPRAPGISGGMNGGGSIIIGVKDIGGW